MLDLRHATPKQWGALALANLDAFLQDHAANERKVSQSALALVAQHPQHRALTDALIPIAEEELLHFRQVYELLVARGSGLVADLPDPYMRALRKAIANPDKDAYLLDRLVLFGIVEARGCERFALMAQTLAEDGSDPTLTAFYEDLVRSESRHHATYLRLARTYFDSDQVQTRLDALLDLEAQVAAEQPLRPALH
ncbi:tRNA-(ms[2]io[6]A)-hydroxylase [Haliangium ochraceum]|uniref:tRNA-hydroxylase n=1 Tax=Haliangium ochraceum (strain DSM 14365 / JCM 11303 / SMP-2) TaxID=502025 RepID=D0LKY7_HALO1|nr:tRNA isopentenyl-2-thiomethyl-A-37 hydroxylase MiaE [Haliangium ochraceum]ACY16707.1 tRNA-hydroxylase [Haliangium ochraceum DSM 14365]